MRLAALLVGLAASGCHLVFDLEPGANDQCWNTKLLGHDEDTDDIEDGCDNCPGDTNDDQADSDEDGVGDLCDPEPQTPGEHIAFFDAFTSPDARWEAFGNGVWSIAGEAVQSGLVEDGTLVLHEEFVNATVQTSFTGQTVIPPADTPSIVGVYVRIPPGQETTHPIPGVLCHSYAKDAKILKVESVPGADPSVMEPFEEAGTVVHLRLSALGVCAGWRDELDAHRLDLGFGQASGKIGLYTHNSQARFGSVTVVESPLR